MRYALFAAFVLSFALIAGCLDTGIPEGTYVPVPSDLFGPAASPGANSSAGVPLTQELLRSVVRKAQSSIVAFVQDDTVIGSGVIIDKTLYSTTVLTNRHVVDENFEYYDPANPADSPNASASRALMVKDSDGNFFRPTKILVPFYAVDLAIVHLPKIAGDVAELDFDYRPQAGDEVIAVGFPQGLPKSVTRGIVSNFVFENLSTAGKYNVLKIQTDTPINPGNSGGGLFEVASGKLIGINTEKILDSEGLGFAIHVRNYRNLISLPWEDVAFNDEELPNLDEDPGLPSDQFG